MNPLEEWTAQVEADKRRQEESPRRSFMSGDEIGDLLDLCQAALEFVVAENERLRRRVVELESEIETRATCITTATQGDHHHEE